MLDFILSKSNVSRQSRIVHLPFTGDTINCTYANLGCDSKQELNQFDILGDFYYKSPLPFLSFVKGNQKYHSIRDYTVDPSINKDYPFPMDHRHPAKLTGSLFVFYRFPPL
jgi:hypothetical protein